VPSHESPILPQMLPPAQIPLLISVEGHLIIIRIADCCIRVLDCLLNPGCCQFFIVFAPGNSILFSRLNQHLTCLLLYHSVDRLGLNQEIDTVREKSFLPKQVCSGDSWHQQSWNVYCKGCVDALQSHWVSRHPARCHKPNPRKRAMLNFCDP